MNKALFFLLFLIGFNVIGQEKNSEIISKLKSLKADNNLAAWVDTRINFATEEPKERLEFLISTEKEAWRRPKSKEEKEAFLYLYINQGYYSLYHGDIIQSIDCYEKANQYQQKNNIDADVEEYILKPLSNNYTRLGDYEKAIYIQNKSLKLALTKKDFVLAASIYSNLSTSYKSKNEIVSAEKAVQNGLAFADKSQANFGLLLSNLADVKNEQGKFDEALAAINKSIIFLKKQKSDDLIAYWLLSAYTLAGNIQLNKNSFSAAEKNYNLALYTINLRFKEGRNREKANIYNQLGKIKIQQTNYQPAIRLFDKSLKLMITNFESLDFKSLPNKEDLYADNRIEEALLGKADALQKLKLLEESLKTNLLAFDVSEKLRNEFTYSGSKTTLQKEGKKLAEKIIDISYLLWLKTKDKTYAEQILLTSELSKARLLMDEIRDNEQRLAAKDKGGLYQQKIKLSNSIAYYQRQYQEKKDSKYLKQISDLNFQLSALQKKLNQSSVSNQLEIKKLLSSIDDYKTALIFFYGENSIYEIVAKKGEDISIIKIEDAPRIKLEISGFMANYFYNGPEKMINNPKVFYEKSNEIYRQLFSKIDIKKYQNLTIIKDGVLNFLPFESLITNSTYSLNISSWPFLINNTSVSYAFSLQTLAQKSTEKKKPLNNLSGLFLSNTGSGKTEIKAVKSEFESLKSLIKGKFLLNENVDLKTFSNALNTSNVMHISSHAYISDNQIPVLELYKSKFYLFELANQNNLPSLVVLSACQTSDGELVAGEGVMSMSRGFIAAGTNSVISGLWNVNDESGSKLMASFYLNLLRTKNPKVALRDAKLDWIKNQKIKIYALPYYWDSLIFAGKIQTIKLEKNSEFLKSKLFYGLLGSTLLLGFLYFYKGRKNKAKAN